MATVDGKNKWCRKNGKFPSICKYFSVHCALYIHTKKKIPYRSRGSYCNWIILFVLSVLPLYGIFKWRLVCICICEWMRYMLVTISLPFFIVSFMPHTSCLMKENDDCMYVYITIRWVMHITYYCCFYSILFVPISVFIHKRCIYLRCGWIDRFWVFFYYFIIIERPSNTICWKLLAGNFFYQN